MSEPTNIPCGRCGAPMHEDGTSHLAASVAMRCVYCGAVESLPADAQHRAMYVAFFVGAAGGGALGLAASRLC